MNLSVVDPRFVDKAWRDGAACLAEACETSGGVTNKKCNKCGDTKPIDDFYKRSEKGRSGHESSCKACKNKYATEKQKEDPERHRKIVAEWRKANPERHRLNEAAWRASNPDKIRIKARNRRAKKRKVGGTLSMGIAKKLLALQKGKCACCGLPLGDDYHLDHIMPLALGGSNTDDNIQLLRAKCNLQKSAKHPVDFMQERGLLL